MEWEPTTTDESPDFLYDGSLFLKYRNVSKQVRNMGFKLAPIFQELSSETTLDAKRVKNRTLMLTTAALWYFLESNSKN